MSEKVNLDTSVKFFITVIGLTVICMVLRELSSIFVPFVVAYFLFFVFSPINEFLKKHKVPSFLIIIFDLAVTGLLAWGISDFIIGYFLEFGEKLPEYYLKLNKVVQEMAVSLGIRDPYFRNFNIEKVISKIDYKLLAGGLFSSTFSFMGSVLFVLFFFVFVVSGHQNMIDALRKRYVTTHISSQRNEEVEELKDKVSNTFNEITGQIQKYIIAKFIINLVSGVAGGFILFLFGVDFPIIWGLLIFLFNFIPTIGSALALILPGLMSLLQFGEPGYTFIIALSIAGMQTLFFNVLEPAILGKTLDLNPILILLSVLIWGFIWGVPGMLLAIPLTAIIKIILLNSDSKNVVLIRDLMSS